MTRRFYRLHFGMKEHPESFRERGYPDLKPGQVYPGGYKDPDDHQLLYPGDIFAVESLLIECLPSRTSDGRTIGWMETPVSDSGEMGPDNKFHPDGKRQAGVPILAIATPVPDATKEVWTQRDEPSRVIGYNISEQEFAEMERKEEAESHVAAPVPSVAAGAPPSVKPAGTRSRPAGTGPARVRR